MNKKKGKNQESPQYMLLTFSSRSVVISLALISVLCIAKVSLEFHYQSFTFYCCFSGRNEVILTPTSFIVIKAVGVASDQCIDKHDNGLVVSGQCNVASLDTFPSALMSEIMQHSDCKPVQFHCRVKYSLI